MTPFQQALLAIEIAVDALHDSGTEAARAALEQIGSLGFDTRPGEERKLAPEKHWRRELRGQGSRVYS